MPEPLPVKWLCKPVESAESGVGVLNDGRVYCWIKHEIVRDGSPEMFFWRLSHLEGDVEVKGTKYRRYRLCHPRDHLFAEYVKRSADCSIGAVR